MAATRHFAWHLGEMYLAMMIGMMALDAVFNGILAVGGTSYADVVDWSPVAVALILMFNMTAPMLLWMRIRGHSATEISEMGMAMVVVGAATAFMVWASVVGSEAICGIECGLMLPAMAAAMLLHPFMRLTGRLTGS